MVLPSIGVVFPAHARVEELPAFARQVERSGLDELWVVEDCFLSGGLAMAAAALATTSTLRVGIGLMPATIRNPALIAMEIATLALLHPNRLTVALGHGVATWMEQIDARPPRRLAALEEVVRAVRGLLAGETVTTAGTHVRLDGVVLERPPECVPPVLLGTTGPKGLAVAGRSADGILLPEGCGPRFAGWALERARESRAGEEPVRCVVYAWLRVDDDGASARLAVEPSVDHWLASGLYPEPYRQAGVEPPLEARGRSDDLVRAVAVAGEAAACAEAITGFAQAGVQSLVLAPVGPDYPEQTARLADDVRPALQISVAR